MINDIAGVGVPIIVRKDFETCLKATVHTYSIIKNSLTAYCSMAMINFSSNLPYTLAKWGTDDISDKYSMIVSNLNASKKPFKVAGKSQLGQFCFVPGVCKLYMSVMFCSTGPHMSMSCYADQERLKNP